jgi:hypothetical protein
MTSQVEQTLATVGRRLVGFYGLVVGSLAAGALALSACGGGGGGLANIAGTGAGSGAGSGGGSGTTVNGTGAPSGGSGTAVVAGTGASTGTVIGGTGAATGSVVGTSQAACTTYCSAIMAACTGNSAQFKDQADCMEYCSFIPAGTGMPGDTSDSIGCRSATLAAAGATPTYSACLQAGPDTLGKCQDEHVSFCTLAFNYCTAANGYTGPALYPDAATCQSDGSLLPNNTENSPNTYASGNFSVNFTPAGGIGMDNSFDCRFYDLVELAMDGADAATRKANAAKYCPSVGNVSPNCGPGYTQSTMGMGAGDGGAAAIGSDAGTMASAFAETGCTPGTKDPVTGLDSNGCYPFATRRMILRDEGSPSLHLIDLGDPTKDWSKATDGAWARTAQLVGIPTGSTTPQVLGGRNNGYEYYDLATGTISHVVNTFANSMSPYRMRNGNTLLTLTGGTIKILDATDKQITSVTYPGHGYVRLGRPAPARAGIFTGQTFLIPSDTALFEGDLNGNIIKTINNGAPGWGHIWLPLVRKDGSVLLGTAFGSSVDVIDWTQTPPKVTFRYGYKGAYTTAATGEANPLCWSMAGGACPALTAGTVNPNFFSEFQILPNGDILTPNWQGHGGGNNGSGMQVIEFNAAGDVVWYYNQRGTGMSSIQGVLLLDGLDPTKLNVQDTDDGTWQAVE